jgi:hypothetical protein
MSRSIGCPRVSVPGSFDVKGIPMKRALTALVVALSAVTAFAADARFVDYATRARGASQVVVATVEDVQPRFDVNEYGDRLIISRTYLRVEETLKGGQQNNLVQVDVEGGTIGDVTLKVSDLPALRRGDRAVFFLTQAANGIHHPQGRGLGIVKLDARNAVPGTTSTLTDIRNAVRSSGR